jgi:adenosylcobinamide-GDP ribazoletransferase
MRSWSADLVAAFMLLTRLPVARFGQPGPLPRSAWAFPLVGIAVNGLGGLFYWLAHRLGMPPLLSAGWCLTGMIAATGGLHEDGLADTADGFGGGATEARKLEIMRDSRIGSFGALALLLSVLVRTAAIAGVQEPWAVAKVLILAGVLGRASMLVVLLRLNPAREGGLGAAMGGIAFSHAATGFGIAAAAAFLLLPAQSATALIVVAAATAIALAEWVRTQIGGYTGDVLGAIELVVECIVLSGATMAFTP